MDKTILIFISGVITALVFTMLIRKIWPGRKKDSTNQISHTENIVEDEKKKDIYAIASELDDLFERSAHPKDLVGAQDFETGVIKLSHESYDTENLLSYAVGENYIIACMALRALEQRDLTEQELTQIINALSRMGLWPVYFSLEIIQHKSLEPRLDEVLSKVQEWWKNYPIAVGILESYINQQFELAKADSLFENLDGYKSEAIEILNELLKDMRGKGASVVKDKIKLWKKHRINKALLESVGRIWDEQVFRVPVVEYDAILQQAQRIQETIFNPPARSMIVVGESGVGKTTLIRYVARYANDMNWLVFEGAAGEVVAGQKYIGELEGRVKSLLATLGAERKVVWYVPDIYEMVAAGSYREKPRGLLDLIMPAIERGELILIGDATPDAFENLLRERPKVKTLFETVRLEPVQDEQALSIAHEWAHIQEEKFGDTVIDKSTINQAFELVQHYLYSTVAPGNILQLLKVTVNRLAASESEYLPVGKDDLLRSLSQITNIPIDILDDRQELDLDIIRNTLQKRVIGQAEAVECLVERIAMIKAGVTDPTRPLGVFLFAGPTGSGKTEIAKTLSEVLFGSENRMIRIDMSEYQASDSSWRLLLENNQQNPSKSFVTQVRQQPYSVVLLDEFEKAHSNVWDLFLQVFDDGRLTDRAGHSVSFRQCIIILTSNLGATISSGTSIGFSKDTASFSPAAVEKAVNLTFRREFINRLDRVIIFNPLTRSVMREIIKKELQLAFNRHGLRHRDWAVEFDDSVIEFLLQKGFTLDLGARPLKRAIERFVLSPLAETIVERRFPKGDQFLFLGRDGDQIQVQFIDPDNPEPVSIAEDNYNGQNDKLDLKTLALLAKGTANEFRFLESQFQVISDALAESKWNHSKDEAMAKMRSPEFWESADRFNTLALIEFMDRLESGYKSAESLLQRLKRIAPTKMPVYHPDMVRRLAEQLYLLDNAYQDFMESSPFDAFILLETKFEKSHDEKQTAEVYSRLLKMYQNWGKRRRMHVQLIANHCDAKGGCRGILAVNGFGAYRILQPESGLHVFEIPAKENQVERFSTKVSVVGQPIGAIDNQQDMRAQAEAVFASVESKTLNVVRRYCEEPTPLVKDSVRNWRTGRIDRVLAGDFDLL